MQHATCKLGFSVCSTGPDLHLQVTLDQDVIYNDVPGSDTQTICYEFEDRIEQQHILAFTMSGKLPDHTLIDSAGHILEDRCIHIRDMAFDSIPLGYIITQVTHYSHDHNGSTDPVTEKFYGVMGCNGRAEMRFSTPIYLWLLENM